MSVFGGALFGGDLFASKRTINDEGPILNSLFRMASHLLAQDDNFAAIGEEKPRKGLDNPL